MGNLFGTTHCRHWNLEIHKMTEHGAGCLFRPEFFIFFLVSKYLEIFLRSRHFFSSVEEEWAGLRPKLRAAVFFFYLWPLVYLLMLLLWKSQRLDSETTSVGRRLPSDTDVNGAISSFFLKKRNFKENSLGRGLDQVFVSVMWCVRC